MNCGHWAEGTAGALQKERGCQRFCLLLFFCTVSLIVVSTCYHLISEKFLIKEGREKGENRKPKTRERRRQRDRGREEGKEGGRKREIEKANKAKNSCWLKMVHCQASFYFARMPGLESFILFLSFSKVNVLIYLEEELFAFCKATFTEETVAEALSMQA